MPAPPPGPALREGELLRALVEAASDGLIALTASGAPGDEPDFAVVGHNARALALLRHLPGDIRGRGIRAEFPMTGAELAGLAEQARRTGAHVEREVGHRDVRPPMTIHVTATPVGGLVLVTVQDITDRRRLEEQLHHAQKMAVVGRLAGGVAHDFKNLLTAIGVNAELALDSADDPASSRAELERVLDGVRRAAEVTQRLLSFARRQTTAPQVVPLHDVVLHASPMLRRVVGNGIELLVVASEDPWSVSIDPAAFEQVLTNLAVNARDAMPGGGQLTLDVANVIVHDGDAASVRHVQPGQYVRLEATDTGAGMTPDTLAHAFEPFFTTKASGEGTGLGLATSSDIVRQSGGAMWARSTIGRGSTFTVLLPRAFARVTPPPSAAIPERPAHGSERVLVVDDEPSVRSVVSRTLQRLGYQTELAGHGEEALRMLEDSRYDLLLSDIVMPRMGGRELARAAQLRYPGMSLLLMSGYDAEQRDVENMHFLRKPFSSSELARAVREAIDGRGSR